MSTLLVNRTSKIVSTTILATKRNISRQCIRGLSDGPVGEATHLSGLVNAYPQSRPFKDIPGPKGLPFIGTLLKYRIGKYRPENYHVAIADHHREFGGIFKETIAGSTVVHLSDPGDYRVVLRACMKDPRVPPFINAILEFRKKNGYTHGLGFSVGDEWRRLRHNSQKYWLNAKNCHAYFDRMSAIADQFVGYISKNIDAKGEVPNLYPMMKIWNLESSAILAFDRSFGAFTDNPETSKIDQLISSNQLMFDMGSRFPFMLPLHDYFMTPMKKQLFRSEQIVYTIVKDLIEETLRKIKDCKNDAESSDKYLWLKHCLSRSELVKNDYNILTQNLLLDGLAGTAPQAANLIYRLAKSPDKQDKLFDEIKREVGPTENETRTSMSNMTYLKACLKEAARLTNVGTEVSRILTEDVELSGFRVPACTRVDLNHFVTCRMEEYFDRPNEFLPERWLRDVNNTNGIHPYAHAQFGAGTRMCPGRLFARQDIELFAVKLLKKYRVEWHQPKNLKQDWKILFAPENNEVPITFEQR